MTHIRNAPRRPRGHIPGNFIREVTLAQSVPDASLTATAAAIARLNTVQALPAISQSASVTTQATVTRSLSSVQSVPAITQVASAASSGVDADWIARSTEPGVVRAHDFLTSEKLVPTLNIGPNAWVLQNGLQDHITQAADGWRIDIRNTDDTGRGDIGFYFGDRATFGPGDTLWLAYDLWGPPEYTWAPWKYDTANVGGAHKLSILSNAASSNVANEIVAQMNYRANQIMGYYQDGNSTSALVEINPFVTSVNNVDIRRQPSFDRQTATPLTGVNPDGGAWTPWQQERARYGLLYSGQSAPEFADGYGDPFSSGIRQMPNEWNTIIMRVAIGNWGSFNSRWTMWHARQGQAPRMVHDAVNIRLGNAARYDTLWLLAYVSRGLPGGRKVASRTNPIPGLSIMGHAGLSTPIGSGTLEYNASTGRARYQAAGQSFGTAYGFSQANGILTRSIKSSGADSYLIVTADPAQLPSSGVVTETVTIADGRPDTFVTYRRPIVSRRTIKAPGGFVPSTGALQAAAAGMASGTWLNASSLTTGLGIFTGGVGASGSRLTFGYQFCRDDVNRRWLLHIGDHNEDAYFAIFNEATGAFTIDHIPSWGAGMTGSGTARHMYAHPVYVQKTGRFYTRGTQTRILRRWVSGTTWTDVNITPLAYNSAAAGHCFHEALDKLLVFQLENGVNGALVAMDPVAETWTTLVSGASSTLAGTGDPHNFCTYNRNSGIAWFGGGNGSDKTWTINAAGTIQAAAALPGALGSLGPSSGYALAIPNPANGNFLVILDGTTWYDFNATTRTYSVRSGSAFPGSRLAQFDGSAGGMAGAIACPIWEWGVIAILSAYSRTQPAQLWLYKP